MFHGAEIPTVKHNTGIIVTKISIRNKILTLSRLLRVIARKIHKKTNGLFPVCMSWLRGNPKELVGNVSETQELKNLPNYNSFEFDEQLKI